MSQVRALTIVCLLSGAACSRATCPDASHVDGVVAQVDGVAWAAQGSWFSTGESLQVVTELTDGWRLSLLAQETLEGESVVAAVEAGAFPMEVRLAAGTEGGWALLYPDEGGSWATQAGGEGLLTLAGDDGLLWGCFEFEAQRDQAWVTVSAGQLRVAEDSLE